MASDDGYDQLSEGQAAKDARILALEMALEEARRR